MSARDVPYRDRGHRHPKWCDRSLCSWFGDAEVVHSGTPVELSGVDCRITLELRVSDELHFNEGLRTNLAFEIRDVNAPADADPLVVYLPLHEVRELRDRLSEQLLRGDVAELVDPVYFAGGGERDE